MYIKRILVIYWSLGMAVGEKIKGWGKHGKAGKEEGKEKKIRLYLGLTPLKRIFLGIVNCHCSLRVKVIL